MKIVFFGTSEVGLPILEALLKDHEVLEVVTSPDAPVGRNRQLRPTPIANLATHLKIPVQKPDNVKNNPEFLQHLQTLGADIFVVVSYGKILPAALLDIPRLKTLNVHFSLLPKYRGAAPIQYALLNGETKTGTTIFILDAEIDHGQVLMQKDLYIDAKDTFITLATKLAEMSADLLINLLPQYEANVITPQEQNHASATFTKLIKKEDGRVDWSRPAQDIYNMFRAYIQWPGIWTTWKGQTFKILKAEALQYADGVPTKEIVQCGSASAPTFLHLQEVQLAGKTAMTMKDFLNGQKDFRTEDLS